MSNREEIQITDLEPSIEGGEDIEYIVQIRGIDATGRPGPWSEELKFTSPQQIPSLQSFNYVPGEGGWRLDNDGSFEVNDGTIRGTLESFNYVPGVSGWQLDPDGFAEFDTGIFRGALRIGENTFNVDSNGNLFIGGSTFNNSPFAVNTNGQIAAMSIDAGFITAGTIGANVVYAGTIVASQITSGTINGNRIPNLDTSKITSGVFDPVFIPNLSADKITAGTLNANNVTISGTLSAVTLSGVGGTFSGNLAATVTTANAVRTNIVRSLNSGEMHVTASAGRNFYLNRGLRIGLTPAGTTFIGHASALTDIGGSSLDVNTNIFYRANPTVTGLTPNIHMGDTTGLLRRITSSIRYKKDVRDAEKLPNLLDLRTVYFKAKEPAEGEDDPDKEHYGVIAEEVDALGLFDLVIYNEENQPESIAFSHFGIALIPYVKELYDRIEELERKINGS